MDNVSPLNDSIPRAELTRFLRAVPNYIVLRNEEEDLFGNVERGDDIDVRVGDPELAERTLFRHLGPSGSTATFGCVQNPITTAPAVTVEGSTVHPTWLGRGDAER